MSVDTVPSAYPRSAVELLPEARELPKQPDGLPARNLLMRTFHIGAPKADDIREALAAEQLAGAGEPASEAEPRVPGSAGGPAPLTAELEDAGLVIPPVHPTAPVEPVSEPVSEPVAAPAVTRVAETPGGEPEPAAVGLVQSWWRKRRGSQAGTDTRARGDVTAAPRRIRPVAVWPVLPLALPAFVAVWGGWVGLGRLAGFGMVDLLPGIVDPGSWATIDSSITLPVGMETYAAYALYVALSGRAPARARRFAAWSAGISLALGALGQIAYHLLVANGYTAAPWPITTAVACMPVAVLGMGFALAHMVRDDGTQQ